MEKGPIRQLGATLWAPASRRNSFVGMELMPNVHFNWAV
jgi:hypothetical protein